MCRVILSAAALGLVLVGCTSDARDSPDPTSTATVDSEAQDPTTSPHEKAPSRLSDVTTEQAELESPSATSSTGDPDELVGMRPYTGWGGSNYAGLEGIVFIEYPCVYLYPQDTREALYSRQDSQFPAFDASTALTGERALLSLVRDWTDYDPETNTLSTRELHYVPETDSYRIGDEGSGEGPIASGDRVSLAGIYDDPILGHEDICQRGFDIRIERISLCKLHACRMEREARRKADASQ